MAVQPVSRWRGAADLAWHWERPLVGYRHPVRWFQPFCPAGTPDRAADAIVASLAARARAHAFLAHAPFASAGGDANERELLDSAARPVHALVYRLLEVLAATQRGVEDPALLRQLFAIDHLGMRTLRALERLGVLGGATARRLPEPLPLSTVMRQAAAQVEHYRRVRIPPTGIDVDVPQDAAPELGLLLAELIENATRFSHPDTDVLVTVAATSGGVRIEVADRGLSMAPDKRAALNRLLAQPDEASPRDQIITGTIGVLVVAILAQRNDVRVVLNPGADAGTRAVVELPDTVLLTPRTTTPGTAVPPATNPSTAAPDEGDTRQQAGLAGPPGWPPVSPRTVPPELGLAEAPPSPAAGSVDEISSRQAETGPAIGTPSADLPALPRRAPNRTLGSAPGARSGPQVPAARPPRRERPATEQAADFLEAVTDTPDAPDGPAAG
ncbi:sensor histidine kinase [Actinomadura meridiana]|uniref:sensor histidine kinase n=1 Tax=Actinomadura meridiana TaxID=559626 RepID=UPI0031E9B260